jgi:hypothetical protein
VYSGLPGIAFLSFLDGEAWVITLQATDQQIKRKEKRRTIQSCHSLQKQNVYDHPGHQNLHTNYAWTQMGYAKIKLMIGQMKEEVTHERLGLETRLVGIGMGFTRYFGGIWPKDCIQGAFKPNQTRLRTTA